MHTHTHTHTHIRYNIRIAASTSGGMGPYSDIIEAITVEQGGLTEPSNTQPHQQIWFIVLMVVIAVVLVTVILVLILVVKYTMYKKKSRKYEGECIDWLKLCTFI